ncbi:protein zerknuellt 2-like [Battus philenor]|uniref:protein zerknuellt 2-like n=1 Tax=Battus philenor TaxID=42288 RepID=UPI0035D12B51
MFSSCVSSVYIVNQSGRDMKHMPCLDDPNNIKRQRVHYLRPRSHQGITTSKRRTVFNSEQVLTLEKVFNKTPYISRQERLELEEKLNISERVIRVWFQNRRRSKTRSPDKHGYVKTDEKAMKQLTTAVDLSMPDIRLDEKCMNFNGQPADIFLDYEPISSVSDHDKEDEVITLQKWEPYDPEASLRRLFDIQSMTIN